MDVHGKTFLSVRTTRNLKTNNSVTINPKNTGWLNPSIRIEWQNANTVKVGLNLVLLGYFVPDFESMSEKL